MYSRGHTFAGDILHKISLHLLVSPSIETAAVKPKLQSHFLTG